MKKTYNFSSIKKEPKPLHRLSIYDKISDIANWEIIGTAEETFQRMCGDERLIPNELIIDVVRANGIKNYVMQNDFESQEAIKSFIFDLIKKTLNSPAFADRKTRETFPLLANFYYYCQKIDRNGTKETEADKIAERCWYGEMAQKRLREKTEKMFSVQPDEAVFREACEKIKKIYGYTDADIDAFRYFVCQSKNHDINPSLNKCLYIWSRRKETGKTSVARAIISILNGEENTDRINKYESTLSKEMQFNDHDLPVVSEANAVLLDEAMPHDTKKVYGHLKSMLTSRGCKFNPKFNSVIHVDCRRNYLFTSNEDVSDFIKDDNDRRFIVVNNERKPKQISFEAIFEIWKTFCQHATPRMDFSDWYREFSFIDGLMTRDKDEAKVNILNHHYILTELEGMKNYLITIGYFYNLIAKTQNPKRDDKKIILAAVNELFGEPYQGKSTWKREVILEVLRENNKEGAFDDKPF